MLAPQGNSRLESARHSTRFVPRSMPADYHTHTPLCHHASGDPESFVDAALAAGLTEYGISDHAPQVPEPFDDWRMTLADLPEYFQWIARAQARAAGRIPIRAGLECDWLTGCEAWIDDLASRRDWDYLIGSVHYLGAWDFDNPIWLGRLLAGLREDGRKRVVRYPGPSGFGEKIRILSGGRSGAVLRTRDRCHRGLRLRDRTQHRRLAQTVCRGLSGTRVSGTRLFRRCAAGDILRCPCPRGNCPRFPAGHWLGESRRLP